MLLKQCRKCKKELPIDKFYTSKYTRDGYRSYCKDCDSKNNHSYYSDHRKELIQKQQEYTQNNREKVREYQTRYSNLHKDERKEYCKQLSHNKRDILNCMKTPCVKCGEERPWVISFHHVDPATKSFGISERFKGSTELIEKEIEKCICLCLNCHAEFHWIYGVKPEFPKQALQEYLDDNFVYEYRNTERKAVDEEFI